MNDTIAHIVLIILYLVVFAWLLWFIDELDRW